MPKATKHWHPDLDYAPVPLSELHAQIDDWIARFGPNAVFMLEGENGSAGARIEFMGEETPEEYEARTAGEIEALLHNKAYWEGQIPHAQGEINKIRDRLSEIERDRPGNSPSTSLEPC